ncbi:FGGY family carbohydrate kinase [Pseudanabaena sp. FACHB-2040]|uniref:FGGY family carbohydrate kinase n=1 Tax=Pseudanabaena sp. FACHB-2040 TaxID=2692859 RepID=UPI001683FC6F|nr:FGGY-family carbohydrate kinase [Pseudanabaena sp. FACHB-2040]
MDLALGIDFGTSGARAAVLDSDYQVVEEVRCAYPSTQADELAEGWRKTLFALLNQLSLEWRRRVGAIAIDATSSTVLLCDTQGQPLTAPLLYNDARGRSLVPQVAQVAPSGHTVCSSTSSLVKLLWWQQTLPPEVWSQARFLLHQADWLGFLLHGQLGLSDYHNALKLGYDVGSLRYPDWLLNLEFSHLLPEVREPGDAIAPLSPDIAAHYGFPSQCQVCAGTTDSIAAFLASGASQPGDAATSLGSTLVLKLLSTTRVDDSHYGVYSHRLGDLWLVGGASNTGGAVLRQFFSGEELTQLSTQIDPDRASSLDYYPLLQPGERFPVNDPDLPPRLTPSADSPVAFLHGLLESMARIEHQGYRLLEDLGASPVQQVYTAGGGAQNPTWTAIRQRLLQRPVSTARYPEAAIGSAHLALQKLRGTTS